MLHFLEMRFRTTLVPQVNDEKRNDSVVGYPHNMFSAICGENSPLSTCSWSHPKPYSIETMESELVFNKSV